MENSYEDDALVTTILSGGMDSVTLLYAALQKTKPAYITALSFNYGQKHVKELERAKEICDALGVRHYIIDLHSVSTLLHSSLTDENMPVPHGHYAEHNMKQTVVPNRNGIMLSIAYGVGISNNSKYLLYGAHAGDHFIYPDCRPEFVTALDAAFKIGNDGFGNISILAPFSKLTKSQIAGVGLKLGVPFEKTWSCYEGIVRPCLKCGTCVERTEAFLENDTPDPLLSPEEWIEAVTIYKQSAENQ